MNMFKMLALAAVMSVATAGASFAQATMTPEECTALMTKSDKNADGSLAMDEAKPFATAVSSSEVKPANEGLMTKEEFMGFCQQGLFKDVKVE